MVYEHNRRPNCTVSDLVMGNEYMFHVFSENICGLSEEAGLSKNTAVISKSGTDALWDGDWLYEIGFEHYKPLNLDLFYSQRLFCAFSGCKLQNLPGCNLIGSQDFLFSAQIFKAAGFRMFTVSQKSFLKQIVVRKRHILTFADALQKKLCDWSSPVKVGGPWRL